MEEQDPYLTRELLRVTPIKFVSDITVSTSINFNPVIVLKKKKNDKITIIDKRERRKKSDLF